MNFLKLLKDIRYRTFYRLLEKSRGDLLTLGDGCSWTIVPALDNQSHVLCAGAGHDISFELALAARFGCSVVLCDPSPTGLSTWEREKRNAPSDVSFLSIALAGIDGKIRLGLPVDETEGSFRSLPNNNGSAILVDARSIPSLINELGWTRIDLLKMDIEGGEFSVLESLHRSHVFVSQICVEFHHGENFASSGADTRRAILKLLRSGYRLVHHTCWDHTFVHHTLL